MKKVLTILLTILLFIPTFLIKSEEEYNDYCLPGTSGDNQTYEVIDCMTFDNDEIFKKTVQWVYNDDWSTDTRALSYGYEGDKYFVQGIGAGYTMYWKGYIPLENSVKDGDGIIIYVDTKDIVVDNPNYSPVGFKFYFSKRVNPGFFASGINDGTNADNQEIVFYSLVGDCMQYDESSDSWSTIALNTSTRCLNIPKNTARYIYIPYSSLGLFGNNDDGSLLSNYIKNSEFQYFTGLKILSNRLGTVDSQGKLYFDDLYFVKNSGSHAHIYNASVTVEATDKHGGYDYEECSICHSRRITNRTDILTQDVSSYHEFKFHYGLDLSKLTTKKVKIDDYIQEVPWMEEETDSNGEKHTFIGWSSNQEHFEPLDPLKVICDNNKDFYAFYVKTSYEYSSDYPKYPALASVISFAGGVYRLPKDNIVFIGNSNNSLYHMMESKMSLDGPTYNNALNGGYSYTYVDFVEAQVIAFKPKIVVIPLTSNDFAYFHMSCLDIMNNIKKTCDIIHDALPETVICLSPVTVLPGRVDEKRAVLKLNELAVQYANSIDYIEYIDDSQFTEEVLDKYPDPSVWETWTHMTGPYLDQRFSIYDNKIREIKANRQLEIHK